MARRHGLIRRRSSSWFSSSFCGDRSPADKISKNGKIGYFRLFISNIDQAEHSEAKSNVLVIHSLDDLKARLAKVILMILIVKFFEHAIAMKFETPLDLLSLAGGITLIGLALYLTHAGEHKSPQKHPPAEQ